MRPRYRRGPQQASKRGGGEGITPRFRSSSEEKLAAYLASKGVAYEYESDVIEYVKPARLAKYTPDFKVGPTYIEVKGIWLPPDRQKLALIKRQHPELDLRILFDRPQTTISSTSRTTYAQAAEQMGIPWAKGPEVPDDWIK